jgi:subtilase family serine protease
MTPDASDRRSPSTIEAQKEHHMRRLTATLGAALLSAGFMTLTLAPVGAGASTARAAHATHVATVRPFAKLLTDHTFATPPTTADCENDFGIACYQPGQIETAYDMAPLYGAGLTGTGETIALVDAFGSPSIGRDLATFDRAFGLPAPPNFTIIQPDGPVRPFDPSNPTMAGWAEETSLDVEYSHAMAPGANILLVETPIAETIGVQGFPQIVEAENYVIDHSLADVISQSFGAPEETFATAHALLSLRSAYANAQTHNVTVLASSGDDGTSGPSDASGSTYFTSRVVDWPASDPLVTGVGGTQLHLNAAGDQVAAANVWNDTNLLGSPAAGSGGISSVFGRPPWQNAESGIVGSSRGVPDIALSAAVDGGVLVYMSFGSLPTGFYIFGGTSEASPLFSGIVAIADQKAGHSLGFLNPQLYALAADNAPGIVDVTTGNNTVTFSQGGQTYTVPGYLAGPGYDLASGLGTVDGANLVDELAAPPPPS